MLSARGVGIVRRGRGLLAVAVLACVLALPSSAAALTDFAWSGATPLPNWSFGANWVGGTAPSGSVGTLSFPALTGCDPTSTTCYQSSNDLTGVSANAISIDDGVPYQITGNGLTLGAGGLTAAPTTVSASANIGLPITLGAAQTWSIAGGSGSQLGIGTVTGSGADSLAVNFSSSGVLSLNDVEVGAVTLAGAGAVGIFGSLNGTNGNPVSLSSPAQLVAVVAGAKSGPLTSTGGAVQVGLGHPLDGTLAVDGAVALDSASSLSMFIDQAGTTPSTDYSQLTATGAVTLDGILALHGPTTRCPALNVDDVYTLVSTTGALTGTFNSVPDGTTVPLICSGGTAPTLRINYTTHTVTATVLTTATGATTTAVAASPSTAVTNQAVTLTATVTPSSSTPTGTAEFDNNGVPISGCTSQPVALNGSSYTATCPTSFAASPAPSVTATFTPTSSSLQSSTSSAANLVVGKDATTTTLYISSATPAVGDPVTYIAVPAPADSGAALPSGTVEFLDNGTAIPDCAGQGGLVNGIASCTLSYASTGSHSITASYPGDGSFTGSTTSSSQAVTVEPPRPQNTAPPAISGDTTQGQTLTETHGTWANSPTSYTYQWGDCDSAGNNCTAIAGATSETYTLTASDVGHTIKVVEIASNAGGSGAAASAATGVVNAPGAPPSAPVSSSPPVVTGPPTVGRTLSTTNGVWSGTPPSGYTYQWQRCSSATACANIGGATDSTYDLTSSDLGMKIRVAVVAVNEVGYGIGISNKVGPVVGTAQIKASLAKELTPKGKPAKIGAIVKAGGYTLSFTALEPGRVVIDWYHGKVLVARGSATFTSAGTKKIKIKLTRAGKKLLRRDNRVTLTVKGTFSASGQPAVIVSKKFTLKR